MLGIDSVHKRCFIAFLVYCAAVLFFLFCISAPRSVFSAQDEEEIIFFEEEESSVSSLPEDSEEVSESSDAASKWLGDKWDSRLSVGGYWENEVGVDIVQDNTIEDVADFRSKVFGYASYKFSERLDARLSLRTQYWVLEGGDSRQEAVFDLYEGYVSAHLKKMDIDIGQQVARWGVCDVLSPLNSINPVNYTSFIDPDIEDHRIPLPMAKIDVYIKDFTMEAVYLPIFQSAIFEPWGGELSFVRSQTEEDEENGEAEAEQITSPYLDPILETFTVGNIDYREERLLTGEAGIKLGYRFGKSLFEVMYFNTREDFPVILYLGEQNPSDPDVGGLLEEEEGYLDLEFNRYDVYGAAFKTHVGKLDFLLEYVYSPKRYMTSWEQMEMVEGDTAIASSTRHQEDGEETEITRYETFEETREWQAVAAEIDYLHPKGKLFIKVGAEHSHYFGAPDMLLFPSDDTTRLLGFVRFYMLDNTVLPELRMIKIIEHWEDEEDEGNNEQWFISPRVTYRYGDKYSFTAGYNLFTFSGGNENPSDNQHISPITFMSENNQYFVSFRINF